MQNNLDEGFFSVDKIKTKVLGRSQEEVDKNLQDFLNKNKEYNPKVLSKKPYRDKSDRFYYEVTYDKKASEDDKSLTGLIKKGSSIVKSTFDKAKEVAGKVSAAIPRKGTLTAKTGFELGQKQAKFTKEHPDVHYGKKYKNEDGSYSVDYFAKQGSQEKEQRTSAQRLNNIQKALGKLSDDKLKKIEDIVNS